MTDQLSGDKSASLKYLPYKRCIVPCCNSDTINSPMKLFIKVPSDPSLRQIWFKQAKIDLYVSTSNNPPDIYFCKDHFERKMTWLKINNYKDIPSRFECQYFKEDEEIPKPPDSTVKFPRKVFTLPPTSQNRTFPYSFKYGNIIPSEEIRISQNETETIVGENVEIENEVTTIIPKEDMFVSRLLQSLKDSPKMPRSFAKKVKYVTIKKLDGKETLSETDITNQDKSNQGITRQNQVQNKANNKKPTSILKSKNPGFSGNHENWNDICDIFFKFYTLMDHDYAINSFNRKHYYRKNHDKRLTPKRPIYPKKKREIKEKVIQKKKKRTCKKKLSDTDSAESFQTYQCDVCFTEYLYKSDLLAHVQVEHGQALKSNAAEVTDSTESFETVTCRYCYIEFRYETDLLLHIEDEHIKYYSINNVIDNDRIEHPDNDESTETFKCNYCDIEYLYKKDLLKHIEEEHENRKVGNNRAEKKNFRNKFNKINVNEDTSNLYTKDLLKHIEEEHFISKISKYRAEKNNLNNKITEDITNLYKKDFLNNIEEEHFISKIGKNRVEKNNLKNKINEDTSNVGSVTFICNYCNVEYLLKDDFLKHIEEDHSEENIQEDCLDIKPEIFQCNKCPSSFINEEDMSKHLHIMHGDILDKYIERINSNKTNTKEYAKNILETDNSIENVNDNARRSSVDSEDSVSLLSGYDNFAELRPENEIKEEVSDPLEDVEISTVYGSFDCMDEMETAFPEILCSITNIQGNVDIETTEDNLPEDMEHKNLEAETVVIKQEHQETDDLPNHKFEYDITVVKTDIPYNNLDIIKCKSCQMTFSSQEDLLDHMHELVNTKAKLFSDTRQLKISCKPEITNINMNKTSDNMSEQLNNGYGNSSKIQKKKTDLKTVGGATNSNKTLSKQFRNCKYCSRKLRKRIFGRKCNRFICSHCESNKVSRPNEFKAKHGLKESKTKRVDSKPDTPKRSTSLSDEKILENMHKFFIKTQKKKLIVKLERYVPPTFEDNCLLKPLREEEEKILVQPYDPTLCKSCLKPLAEEEKTVQLGAVCNKCKTLETSNEKRMSDKKRKSNEKRRQSNEKNVDKHANKEQKIKNKFGCNMCKSRFNNTLDLREHVARRHL